jgi:hypothetical protein
MKERAVCSFSAALNPAVTTGGGSSATSPENRDTWKRTFGGATEDGGFVLTEVTQSFGSGGMDIYLIKIDSGGNLL